MRNASELPLLCGLAIFFFLGHAVTRLHVPLISFLKSVCGKSSFFVKYNIPVRLLLDLRVGELCDGQAWQASRGNTAFAARFSRVFDVDGTRRVGPKVSERQAVHPRDKSCTNCVVCTYMIDDVPLSGIVLLKASLYY